jgi:hypothetical protein
VCTCQPRNCRKLEVVEQQFRAAWVKSETPVSKITSAKRAGNMAQVVELLPHKHKALNSNPSNGTTKKNKTV